MTSKRWHLVLLGIILMLFAGLIAGAYGINSLASSESKKLASLKAKDQALSQQKTGLVAAKKGIEKYSELEKIAHAVVPEDKNQAETVRQLTNIAAVHSVTLASITFPASTLGGTGTAPAAGAAATPVPTANTKTSQLTPVPAIPGVYQLPITITSDTKRTVPYSKFISFLSALENNRRTAQVTNISIQPDNVNRSNVSFIITLNEYIKP